MASNWNLEEAVERGKFRRDLYYRLNVMSFHLPPLRERVQDIAPLVRGMAARFNTKFRKDLFDISPAAMAALEAFPWPGNIRQLENVVQQAVLVSTGPELLLQHLPRPSRNTHRSFRPMATASAAILCTITAKLPNGLAFKGPGELRLQPARAANALGISRVTLYKKMKKYGLMGVPLHPAEAQ